MKKNLDRRQFNALTAAAMGGLLAGGVVGCGGKKPVANPATPGDTPPAADDKEKHLCRGLNSCESNGAKGENACRGQGACATIASHDCGELNACKNQGGCGDTVGANACKEKGGCAVPLMDGAWDKMRARLEAEWKEKELEFGEAPAKS